MNLRILKKLSKKAKMLIEADLRNSELDLFLSESGDNYTNTYKHDRKHWERMQSVHGDCFFKKDIKKKTKYGYVLLSQQFIHPWKNTDMVGWMCGYYEPEWEEETLWGRFKGEVWHHFNDYVEIDGELDSDGYPKLEWKSNKKLRNPSDYFKAFNIIKDKQ